MPSAIAATLASRPGEITHILAERTVLALVRSPFIVPLKFSFQTADKLYLVMPFGLSLLHCHFGLIHNVHLVNGGELFHHLQQEGRFDTVRSRFYISELLCALEHLHSFNVIYRYVIT
jgi:serum/glucocorticoid-regulated kinase 2